MRVKKESTRRLHSYASPLTAKNKKDTCQFVKRGIQ